jgi:uncharacterized protein (TIGR02246 family)
MDPISVVQRMYAAANAHDLTAIDDIFAPDFYSHAMRRAGRDPIRAAWRAMFERYPALRLTATEMISRGDRVALWTRIDIGEGPPATMMEMVRVADGRVAEVWGLSTLGVTDERRQA